MGGCSAETGVMHYQPKVAKTDRHYQRLKRWGRTLLLGRREHGCAETLILNFRPPEPREKKFLLF